MLIKYLCKVSAYTKLLFSLVYLHIVSCKNKMAACIAHEAYSELKWIKVMGEKINQ